MGMENVADSLIPGFDKLEEKFIELVQTMKSLMGDFEPVAERAKAVQAAGTDAGDEELRSQISTGIAKVEKLQVELEAAANLLEGKIEKEEVKWQGAGAAPAISAAPRPLGATDVDSIVADLANSGS